jgi:hypothetical protein
MRVDPEGCVWIRKGACGSGRVRVDPEGCVWIRKGACGSGRVCVDPEGCVWIRKGACGSGRVRVDPEGCVWIRFFFSHAQVLGVASLRVWGGGGGQYTSWACFVISGRHQKSMSLEDHAFYTRVMRSVVGSCVLY